MENYHQEIFKKNTENEEYPIFDWEEYIKKYKDLGEVGITTKEEAFHHWINYGKQEGRTYKTCDLETDFDWKQYIKNYDDLKDSGVDTKKKAIYHWVHHGKQEGRTYKTVDLEPDFDWKQYIKNHDDLKDSGVNTKKKAIYHWIHHGREEGRNYKNSVTTINYDDYSDLDSFNWEDYISNYDDLKESGLDTEKKALDHWINHGKQEKRSYKKSLNTTNYSDLINLDLFDWEDYVNNYEDLKKSGINTKEKAISHFLNFGINECRFFRYNNSEIIDDVSREYEPKNIIDSSFETNDEIIDLEEKVNIFFDEDEETNVETNQETNQETNLETNPDTENPDIEIYNLSDEKLFDEKVSDIDIDNDKNLFNDDTDSDADFGEKVFKENDEEIEIKFEEIYNTTDFTKDDIFIIYKNVCFRPTLLKQL
jgi:hypothetical protein